METMEFVRGDPNYHTCAIPVAAWSPGGRLFFAAKQAVDDDDTDSEALIECDWGDSSVTDVTLTYVDPTTNQSVTASFKQYAATFPPATTNDIVSGGAASLDLLGEYQYVPSGNAGPMTFPGIGDKIPVTVWFDIKRKTTE